MSINSQPEVLLVNTNILRPPVSPVGLEYVGEALVEAGFGVRVLDLTFEEDWRAGLARELAVEEPLLVGLTVRNTDDCSFATGRSFLPWIREVVGEVRQLTGALVLLGGVGFSVMPETVLKVTGADAGIAGDGEEVLPVLARRLTAGDDFTDLPNMVYRREGNIFTNRRVDVDTSRLPLPRRRLFDNAAYEHHGAMVGIETKRGCSGRCIYCADPVAKGSSDRLRPPGVIVQEFRDLLANGVSWFHLCDSEFNMPLAHAKEVCRALVDNGLGEKIHWYCYCSPAPFDGELADLMVRAGCNGVNFGVDSLCDDQLARLGRDYSVDDIERLTDLLKTVKLSYIFDMLVGGPGESRETVATSIEAVRLLGVPLAGISLGLRVYPGTPLERAITRGHVTNGLHGAGAPGVPLFYMSPQLGDDPVRLVHDLVAGDPRFLFLAAPSAEASYNYAGDEALCRTIEEGARGAYWDIISRGR